MIVENGVPGDAALWVRAGIVSSLDESSQGESAFNAQVGLGSRKRIAAAASKPLVSHHQAEAGRRLGLERLAEPFQNGSIFATRHKRYGQMEQLLPFLSSEG